MQRCQRLWYTGRQGDRRCATLLPFDYVVPADLAEAVAVLAAGSGSVLPLMGGTDLLMRIRAGITHPAQLLDVKGLPGMQRIAGRENGWLVLGAACTLNQVAAHAGVQTQYALLAQACNSVASYQLRNRATLGGNLCNASPAADTAPALYCLEAVLEAFGPLGLRRIPISEFFVAPGRSALQRGELVTGIHLPPAPPGAHGVFAKLGRTKAGDISTVSAAVYAWPETAGRMMKEDTRDSSPMLRRRWAIALGAVGPTPMRVPEAEAALAGGFSPSAAAKAAGLAARAARPIDDIRASAAYREAMVEVLVRRSIEAVAESSGDRS